MRYVCCVLSNRFASATKRYLAGGRFRLHIGWPFRMYTVYNKTTTQMPIIQSMTLFCLRNNTTIQTIILLIGLSFVQRNKPKKNTNRMGDLFRRWFRNQFGYTSRRMRLLIYIRNAHNAFAYVEYGLFRACHLMLHSRASSSRFYEEQAQSETDRNTEEARSE